MLPTRRTATTPNTYSETTMTDLLFILLTLGFFIISLAYAEACGKL
jgi:hypothetical protein